MGDRSVVTVLIMCGDRRWGTDVMSIVILNFFADETSMKPCSGVLLSVVLLIQ